MQDLPGIAPGEAPKIYPCIQINVDLSQRSSFSHSGISAVGDVAKGNH
jgi:hypothetical protein